MNARRELTDEPRRSALVTGAGGGLGRALVKRLAENGWLVFAGDLDDAQLQVFQSSANLVPIILDVTAQESIAAARQTIEAQTAGLDAIVNFAGVMGVGSLTDIPEARLQRILDINVMGTYRVNKAFLPLVERAKGRLVNISSETGWQTTAPFNGPYAMTKYAIEAYSHALRRELALLGVAVITIQPGPFKTDMVEGIERAFSVAESETMRFKRVIQRLKRLAGKQIRSAHDPTLLAATIEKALTVRRPKPVYSVKPDPLRSSLERLPLSAIDRAYLTILRKANKD
ncbi:MAG: SDR family NAD(P)-dependent oxidoreductase [Polyangiales bacterium]